VGIVTPGLRFRSTPLPKLKLAGEEVKLKRDVASRWTPKLAQAGWTPISTVFLHNYTKLQPPITSSEAMLICQLMTHKWDKDRPYPGFKLIAERMGITHTAARNHARHLEQKNYVKRIKRVGTTNEFDLSPLFRALEALLIAKVNRAKGSAPPDKRAAGT
jgi:hypothetical protein